MYQYLTLINQKLEVLKSIQEADAVFIGSSTRYADMIGNLEDILKEMTEMNLEGKIAASFGSYGWSGEAIEVIQDYLNETNMNVQSTSKVIKSTGMTHVEFPIRIRFSQEMRKSKENPTCNNICYRFIIEFYLIEKWR